MISFLSPLLSALLALAPFAPAVPTEARTPPRELEATTRGNVLFVSSEGHRPGSQVHFDLYVPGDLGPMPVIHRASTRAGITGTAKGKLPIRVGIGSGSVATGTLATVTAHGKSFTGASIANQVRVPLRPSLGELSMLSDSFDGTALHPKWNILHPQFVQISVSNGELHLRSLQSGGAASWFQDGEGSLVYQELTGDFTVTARVRATDPSSPGSTAPPAQWRFGGVLVRDPGSTPGNRRYSHLVVGAGSNSVPVCVEDKNTSASQSTWFLHPLPTAAQAELRIVRRGDDLELAHRPVTGGAWTVIQNNHTHANLPATLQVGLNLYSVTSPPDLEVHIDEILFSQP